jgi:hypothetical protein
MASNIARLELSILPAATLLALAGCASEPLPAPEGWQTSPARITRSFRSEGPLRAGAAREPLDPPYSVPMAGYFGANHFLLREQRDPLSVRAVVIEGGGRRVALVALDLLLVPPGLRRQIEASPEVQSAGLEGFTVFASHVHTSLGAFAEPWAAQMFGVGDFDPLILRYIARQSARAIARAAERLAAVEPGFGSARPAEGEPTLSFNRKIIGLPTDPTVRALGLWPVGAAAAGAGASAMPVVRLVNFAGHPTMIPATLRSASADYPGVLCRALEAEGDGSAISLFLNGPCGDIAGGMYEDERAFWERRMPLEGERIARLAREALDGAPRRDAPVAFAWSEGEILLPPRHPWRVPLVGRQIAEQYPDRVTARALRIGDLAMVFVPGELGSDVGGRIRDDLLKTSGAPAAAWVVTLADDYFGYVFSREQYRAGGHSQHLTIYGEDVGDLLHDRLLEVAGACWR